MIEEKKQYCFEFNNEKINTLKGLYLHGSFGSGKTFLIDPI